MAIYSDLSGNTPEADSDVSLPGNYDLQAVAFTGANQSIVIGATSLSSTPFARQARVIRIAPDANMHYAIGTAPTADGDSRYLAAGAVEIVPITGGQIIAIIRDATESGAVIITEDK